MRRELALDIRLMNFTSRALVWLFAAGALFVAGNWLLMRPLWAIRVVRVQGSLQHISASALRSQALPRLHGNWFTIDLGAAQQAFARVPWVRDAVVQRVWPLSLLVTLQAQQPVAIWGGASASQLVDAQGALFDANIGEVQDMHLPQFDGPPGSAQRVLLMARELDARLAALRWRVAALALGAEGDWHVQLAGGPTLNLGSDADAAAFGARLQRFVALAPQVQQQYGRAIVSADLRYANGFAVRLQGAAAPGAQHPVATSAAAHKQIHTGARGAR